MKEQEVFLHFLLEVFASLNVIDSIIKAEAEIFNDWAAMLGSFRLLAHMLPLSRLFLYPLILQIKNNFNTCIKLYVFMGLIQLINIKIDT